LVSLLGERYAAVKLIAILVMVSLKLSKYLNVAKTEIPILGLLLIKS